MKCFYLIFPLFVITSCSTQPKQVAISSLVENYVKSQMKDPSSFQLIQTQVGDTVMMSKFLRDNYSKDTSMISKTMGENELDVLSQNFTPKESTEREKYKQLLDKKTAIYRESATKDSLEIARHEPDRVFYIPYMVEYRAKNSLGALDKAVSLIEYYPADTTFKMRTP